MDTVKTRGWVWIVLGAFALATLATYAIGYPKMFAGFAPYDDEGTVLVSLKLFMDQGALYDQVFAQYGPFYYQVWGAFFSLFDLSISHDTGRSVALATWVLASLVVGLSTYRITRSLLLGLVAQILSFTALRTLTSEPMHPGGLICLMLACIVAASAFVRRRPSALPMALVGAGMGALLLVKVNVGIFALAALLLALAASYGSLAGRKWLRPLLEVGFVLIPAALMARELGQSWAQEYAAHVTIAALAIVVLLRCRPIDPARGARELWWLAGAFLVTALLISAVALGTGTSVGGLIDGVVIKPAGQPDGFSIPFALSDRVLGLDLIALAAAVVYWYVNRSGRREPGAAWRVLVSLFSLAVGVEMGLSVIGEGVPFSPASVSGYQLSMLAFAWVALIPPAGIREEGGPELAMRLLPALAVLQGLHAFPVAGSQLGWASFLLVPVGAVCVSNGLRGLVAAYPAGVERRSLAALGAVAAVALGAFLANLTLRRAFDENRAVFDSAVPLELPGSVTMRVPPADAAVYRQVADAIDRNCSDFLTLPGMSSFYLWTERDPPSLNPAGWMALFGDEEQRRVVRAVRSQDGTCLLENKAEGLKWAMGQEPPGGPLVRFMRAEFEPFRRFGPYELLKRDGA